MHKPAFVWTVFLGSLLLSGCWDQEASKPAQSPPSANKVAVAPPQPVPDPAAPAEAAPPPYKYDPTDRRDPFAPLMAVRRSIPGESAVPMTPLQTFDLAQLRLIAVIIGKDAPRAMVIAPDGKGYILQKGIKVGKNNGTVMAIRRDAVVIREKYYDFSGEIRENTLEIVVPKREGV